MLLHLLLGYVILPVKLFTSAAAAQSQCHGAYYHRPECVDYPDGYGCRCGPGYVWNSGYCVAIGLDSRFEFQKLTPLRYAVVLNKAFPELSVFTIAMWIKVTSAQKRSRSSTVLSYTDKPGNQPIVRIYLEPDLRLQLYQEDIKTGIRLNASEWTHLVWTQSIQDGTWKLFINAMQFTFQGVLTTSQLIVPPGGELVLGQSARPLEGLFDSKLAFLGHLAFVNVWSHVLTRAEVKAVYRDCTLQLCGDAIEWADFRSGTRGALRIRWPSFVYGRKSCFQDDPTACEIYCSKVNGAKCRAETVANINWPRTVVQSSAAVPCPGEDDSVSPNVTTNVATRVCTPVEGNTWKWESPDVTGCTTETLLDMRSKIVSVGVDNVLNASEVLLVAQNMTEEMSRSNPIDLSTIIDTLDIIIQKQGRNIEKTESSKHSRATRTFTPNRSKDPSAYPTWEDTQYFTTQIAELLESLVNSGNSRSWTLSQPVGNEGDHLLKVVDDFFATLEKSLEYHLKQGEITFNQARLDLSSDLIKFSVRAYTRQRKKILTFPAIVSEVSGLNQSNISISTETLFHTSSEYAILSTALFNISKLIPNHDIFRKSKDDNVNSVIASVGIYNSQTQMLPAPFDIFFPYHETFNISNPECVRLEHKTRSEPWKWSKEGCVLVPGSKTGVTCRCQKLGWYTVITDMYDIHFKKIETSQPLLEAPSYVGSIISSTMCLISVIMLMYFKTKSKTAGIHKHFGTSVVLLQMTFIIGINRNEYTTLCHALAICLHYFFLSTFLWLMNEAFNLYILITYAAHSHGEQNEGGSDWRYYLLGWALPAVLVGSIAGSQKDTYYADDMCWIAWRHVWLFCGPAIGIISVTILVLIFTAKEHHESAYSKKEDTNNTIVLYAKAVWTQVILLTVSWTFAFLSIKMRGSIIEWISAFLNIIQGAFFAVYYFWLNDEVHQQKVKQKSHTDKAGYHCSSNASFEEHVELTICEENDTDNRPCSSSNSNRTTSRFVKRNFGGRISEEETTDISSDDISDPDVWERRVLTTTSL